MCLPSTMAFHCVTEMEKQLFSISFFKSCMVYNLFYKSLYKYSEFIILNNCI